MKRAGIVLVVAASLTFGGCVKAPAQASYPVKHDRTAAKRKPQRKGKVFQRGVASWYGTKYHGRTTASGEPFNMHELTAAHPKLPFGTKIEVTRPSNGRSVKVRINDRGPFARGRVVDLSYAAAKRLDLVNDGIDKVEIRILKRPG